MLSIVSVLRSLLCFAQLAAGPSTSETVIAFRDVTEQSSIRFKHQDGGSGHQYLPEHMGAGLCTFDADNDGWLDVFLLNGRALQGAEVVGDPSNGFFRNLQSLRFSDATCQAGLTDRSYSLGVTAADYDQDGFVDLYVSNFGPNQLWRNNGDGTFCEVTDMAGVVDGDKFGAGVSFLDIENDGDLDLFVGNYVEFDYERHHLLAPNAFPYAPGPRDFPRLADSLFLNNGDGTFFDNSYNSGIAQTTAPSMGVTCADFDSDGDVDIFVACDGAANLLYINDGGGRFTEDAIISGVAYDQRGVANGSMGVDVGDVDGNGSLDLLVTDYSFQLPEFYQNSSVLGFFDEAARSFKVDASLIPHVNWGVGLVDLDNDGDIDAFVCNGHLLENAKEIEPQTEFGVPNVVMENLGNQEFRGVSTVLGEPLQPADSSRGAAFDDLDNDGDIDIVILNNDAMVQVLENRSKKPYHWVTLQLSGVHSNRSAIGAKVTIEAGGNRYFREVVNGRGYQSHYGGRLHVGLGHAARIDRIEIQWPGGNEATELLDIAADQHLVVTQ